LVIVSYATTAVRGEVGITTEVTALLAFIVGALCGWEQVAVASVATVVCLLLLTLKDFLHGLARCKCRDPPCTTWNETFVLPRRHQILKVADGRSSGLNFSAICWLVLGNEVRLVVTGILGGLVSSTAVAELPSAAGVNRR
jgi:uncharacterized membrane protein (DUF4010 family)